MVMRFQIKADRPLQPGNSVLLLSVRATDKAGHGISTVTTDKVMKLSVLGESGLLTVLGVPGLLFVPALVFGVVLWFLLRYVYPGEHSRLKDIGTETKAGIWVLLALPTLAFPFLYPLVTGWFGQRRDYRAVYGLDDLLYVWLMAFATAIVFWLVAIALYKLYKLFERIRAAPGHS